VQGSIPTAKARAVFVPSGWLESRWPAASRCQHRNQSRSLHLRNEAMLPRQALKEYCLSVVSSGGSEAIPHVPPQDPLAARRGGNPLWKTAIDTAPTVRRE